jgi:hypothetical protein
MGHGLHDQRRAPGSIEQFKINWQGQPDKVPEVKNYTGWDHMRCDMDKH